MEKGIMSKTYWTERTIPDTKIGRRLYKNQIVRIDDTGIVLRVEQEFGTFTAQESGSYILSCTIFTTYGDKSSDIHTKSETIVLKQGETEHWPNGWTVPSNYRESFITKYSVRKVY